MPDVASVAHGVYKPRRPQASPLFRLVSDHLQRLQTVYDERFAREYGSWRPVVAQVADKFLACGVLDHGFTRMRCDACMHEYLLAFSCKCRYFCPSCHAKRLAIWTQWLDTTLLAPVPHRRVVLTIPKRLRAYCLYRRHLLGEIGMTTMERAWHVEHAVSALVVGCAHRRESAGVGLSIPAHRRPAARAGSRRPAGVQSVSRVAGHAVRPATSAHRTHGQLPPPHRRAPVHTTIVPHPLKMSWNSAGPKPA